MQGEGAGSSFDSAAEAKNPEEAIVQASFCARVSLLVTQVLVRVIISLGGISKLHVV